MNSNIELIQHFYTCFQQRDFKGMQDCYAHDARFTDPVFTGLDGKETRAMWEMLCKRGKDLVIDFSDVKADEQSGSAVWVAHYTFSQTGRKVVNHVKARFEFGNGLISSHQDDFNFYQWARQALGLPGLLLGWTPVFRHKIQNTARKGLHRFMQQSH
ncbi:MAG: nuclear transport factor 2 family protein [Flavisolibacter sp.]